MQFQNGYYYHIYNRGVDKRKVFLDEKDYARFLRSLREFNNKKTSGSLYLQSKLRNKRGSTSFREVEPLVDIICYCLNPNHYHLLLRQEKENGISKFMHKISTGYTRYFNEKYKRTGPLFSGRYKAKAVKTDGYLRQLSCYIHPVR